MSRFSDILMELFQSPVNRAAMERPDFIGRGSLGGYPPLVILYLHIIEDHVAEATFEAAGCGVTIACGSMLTELVRGRSREECAQITAQQLSEALDGVPTDKEYCADVAISALHDAIHNWR